MATSVHKLAVIRRVLLGLGSAGTPAGMLDLAAELAQALHAELAGLFVEEEEVYAAQGVAGFGGKPRQLDRGLLGDAIAAEARAFRRALSARAKLSHVVCTFESRRGEALPVFRGSVRADDVLLLAGSAATITPRARMEFALQAMGGARAVLIVPERLRRDGGAIAVFADDGDDDDHIAFAANIARTMRTPLLILTGQRESAGHERELMRRYAMETRPDARIARLPSDDPAEIAEILRSLAPRLVVTRVAGALFTDTGTAAMLMQAAGAPLLLLRSGA